jgi:hypothetical protein
VVIPAGQREASWCWSPRLEADSVLRRLDGLSDPGTGPLTSGAGGASAAASRLSGTAWSQCASGDRAAVNDPALSRRRTPECQRRAGGAHPTAASSHPTPTPLAATTVNGRPGLAERDPGRGDYRNWLAAATPTGRRRLRDDLVAAAWRLADPGVWVGAGDPRGRRCARGGLPPSGPGRRQIPAGALVSGFRRGPGCGVRRPRRQRPSSVGMGVRPPGPRRPFTRRPGPALAPRAPQPQDR